ncbi:MAG: glycosyltransferase family 4 protein [Opitutales bacterium]
MKYPWVCSQLGSREHYSIPRVLRRDRALAFFLTDFWNDYPAWFGKTLPARFKKVLERKHPELDGQAVVHLGLGRLRFDLTAKARQWSAWKTIVQRNAYYQRQLLSELRPLQDDLRAKAPGVFFSYSYTADRLFEFFKELGWYCVLCQIDPAREEEDRVMAETNAHPEWADAATRAPSIYWERWSRECALADRILVNSPWSAEALQRQGIEKERLQVVPLAYESPPKPPDESLHALPASFTMERPLRVLYLGQVVPRKGVRLLLEAIDALRERPIELWMVGPVRMEVPAACLNHPRVRWTGAVSRSEAQAQYQQADVFVLPTLSDGFAITQLEAQAYGVPVLASQRCGEVVRDRENGLLLEPLCTETIVEAFAHCLDHPAEVERWSRQSQVDAAFSMEALQANLRTVEAHLQGMKTAPGRHA